MFDAIISFFESIGTFFSTVWDFIIDFFNGLISVVTMTGEFVLMIPDYFSWLPASVLALVVAIFSVVVIYKIIGREG